MYTNDREAYRDMFFMVWEKFQKNLPLQGVEAYLVEIMKDHPEYHALLSHPQAGQRQEFLPEENPFVHMSLHLALQEQIRMDRPGSIASVYEGLVARYGDSHQAEHQMMHCLAAMMWDAQQSGETPDEQVYLRNLLQL